MMATDSRERATVTTGRPLDRNGNAMNGPALELDPDSRAATLLAETSQPLVSSPDAGIWATLLERPADGQTDRPVVLQWLSPDAAAPPTHVHPTTETFEAITGELTAVVEGTPTRLRPGETVTVESGQAHTFRNETEEVVAFRAEMPSLRTVRGLYTAWGLDHDRASTGDFSGPGALHGLVLSADLSDETQVTVVPIAVQQALWTTIGRAARTLGYSGIDERYTTDSFWERHVEQPRL